MFKKWRVLTGSHGMDVNGGVVSFRKGETFVTEADMARFNTDKQRPKYEDLGEVSEKEALDWVAKQGFSNTKDGSTKVPPSKEEVAATPEDSLAALTVVQLKELAHDEKISLTGASTKDEILKVIRDARAKQVEDE